MTQPISKQYTLTLSSLRRAQQDLSHMRTSDASIAKAAIGPNIRDHSETSLASIQHELKALCGDGFSGEIDKAWRNYAEKKESIEGELPGISESEASIKIESIRARIEKNNSLIEKNASFLDALSNPKAPIAPPAKQVADHLLEEINTELSDLCGTSSNGKIDAAWKKYDTFKTDESFQKYKILDERKEHLFSLQKFLENFISSESLESFTADESLLSSLTENLSRANDKLKQDIDALIPLLHKSHAEFIAIQAFSTYKRLDERRVELESLITLHAPQDTHSTKDSEASAAAAACVAAASHYETRPPRFVDGIKPVKDIIAFNDFCYKPDSCTYNGDGLTENFNFESFNALLRKNNELFTYSFKDSDYGYIEKKEVPPSSKVFVRADLHGDLRSLMENLKELQKQGLLDENFHCRPNTHLVFLGDYTDRGPHSMQVLELLLTLRMENPDHVTLIRGNHESLDINAFFCAGDPNFQKAICKPEHRELQNILDLTYKTFSLTTYIGQRSKDGSIQYTGFTHGLFEFHVDPQEILSKPGQAKMPVPMAAEHSLSDRILKLESDISSPKCPREVKLLRILNRVKFLNETSQRFRTYELVYGHKLSSYNWGDMSESVSSLKYLGNRTWEISPLDVYNYIKLVSTHDAKVKLIFRGHEHLKQHYQASVTKKDGSKADKLVVTTLPIGMDGETSYVSRFPGQQDTGYILTTSDKIKDWTKQAMLRGTRSSQTHVTETYPIGSKNV